MAWRGRFEPYRIKSNQYLILQNRKSWGYYGDNYEKMDGALHLHIELHQIKIIIIKIEKKESEKREKRKTLYMCTSDKS